MRNWMVLSSVVFSEVTGNLCLSHGMRQIGPVGVLTQLSIVFITVGRMVGNPWVLAGVAFLILYFVSYLEALSRLELSYVLPMTASTYIVTTFIAWQVLGEQIVSSRWIGTAAVAVGVFLVSRSGLKKEGVPV